MEVGIGQNRWQVKCPFAVVEDTLRADPESPAAGPSPARLGCVSGTHRARADLWANLGLSLCQMDAMRSQRCMHLVVMAIKFLKS